MSNIKKGAKLTVSTGNGISRHTTENLGVLEVSGPAMSDTTTDYTTNTAQLTIGATDVSGVLKLGINNDGNTFIDAIRGGNHTDIIMQKYGGDVIIGSGADSIAKVGIRTNAPDSTFHINSTDGLIIPVGTNGERPDPAYNGMIRYNTTTSQFEGYGPGSAWGSLGGVKDVNGDTYILAETTAGANNDDLQFFTAGQERMSINSVGDISMNGATYISGNLLLGTTTDSGYQLSTSSINCTNNLNVSGTITGNVTGNVTGNCSGTAATVTTAAQPNITSLGTLTSLNVSGNIGGTNGILINGNGVGISHAAPTNSTYQLEVGGSVKVDSKLIVDGNVGIGTTSPDRGLCILDNQNTGQAIGNYYIGYNTSNQEPGALKIFQHLPITSGTYRISDGGGNLDPAINIITNFIGSGATSATHQGGCIQWTTQSRENPTSGAAHGQPYAAIYGGRHSDIANHEGEMIFYTSDTTNRASGPNLNPRMTIKGGNVGIGTTSPDELLHVGGSVKVDSNLYVDNLVGIGIDPTSAITLNVRPTLYNNGIKVQTSTSSASVYSAQFLGSGGSGLTVLANGSVGIGTTSGFDSFKLRIEGATSSAQIYATGGNYGIRVDTNNSTSAYCAKFIGDTSKGLEVRSNGETRIIGGKLIYDVTGRSSMTNANTGISLSHGTYELPIIHVEDPTNKGHLCFQPTNGASDSSIIFKSYASTTTWNGTAGFGTERMRIQHDGKVGIGTTSPGSTLEIKDVTSGTAGEVESILKVNNSSGYHMVSLGTAGPDHYNAGSISIYKTTNATGTIKSVHLSGSLDDTYFNGGGNVGIGIPSPAELLHVKGQLSLYTNEISGTEEAQTSKAGTSNIIFASNNYAPSINNSLQSNGLKWKSLAQFGGVSNYDKTTAAIYFTPENNWFRGALTFHTNGGQNTTGSSSERMRITNGGNIGIGTATPQYPLHVIGYNHSFSYYGYLNDGGASGANGTNGGDTGWGIYCNKSIATHTAFYVSSDRRIKENIVDVSDNLALEQVRNIPCRYYEYKDKVNRGTGKTIGFIAQEVREILPMAISIQTNFVPNEMRVLTDISWNGTTLYTDISGSSAKYRFYVSNDVSGNDEIKKEITGSGSTGFKFDKQYNFVFCYGREVDDFHTIDKNKLFALNFSATQEIDRIQQQHIIDISNAQSTIQSHETTIQTLQTDLSTANTTIQTLQTDLSNANTTIQQQDTTIQQHETTIQQQQQQIADILSRLESLESSA